MNILSVDTTTKVAAVALQTNNTITQKKVDNEITHSEKLLPLIDEILQKQSLNINDIEKYIVLNGPGSFTGVRIGLATIKAFSMVNNKEIISISSLEAIALSLYVKLNTSDTKYILSLLDARNNRVYHGLFKVSTNENNKINIEKVYNQSNDLLEDVIHNIDNINISKDKIILAGNCINIYRNNLPNNFTTSNLYELYPTPKELIQNYTKINKIQDYIYNTYTLDANYVRPSQAERIKNEHEGK